MDKKIIEQLAILKQLCPFESVDLWVSQRTPDGPLAFTAAADGNKSYDLEFACSTADTPEKAVEKFKADNCPRDEAAAKIKRLARLREELKQLEASIEKESIEKEKSEKPPF